MDVGAFLQALPEEAPRQLVDLAKRIGELGEEYTVFHCERVAAPPQMEEIMENQTAGKKQWATVCDCLACGETWVTRKGTTKDSFWVLEGEDGNVYASELIPMGYDYAAEIEVTEGDSLLCPCCGSETRIIRQNRLRGGRTKQIQVAQLTNIDGYTTILYWMVGRTIYEYGDSLWAVPRYAYALDEKGRIKPFSHKEGGGAFCTEKNTYWHPMSSAEDRWWAQYQDWGSINNRKAGTCMWSVIPAQEDMVGTTGEKTGVWSYWNDKNSGEYPVGYLKLWKKAPAVENLANAGFGKILQDIVAASMRGYYLMTEAGKSLDLTKRKPNEILGLSKADFREFPRSAGTEQLNIVKHYRSLGGTLPVAELLDKLKGVPSGILFQQMEAFGGSLEKYENYLVKQRMGLREIQTLADARGMAQRLHPETPLTEEEVWPRNLLAVHERLTRQTTLKIDSAKNAELQDGFDAVLERYGDIQWTDKDLAVILPKSNLELVVEGNTLNHCVGGYGDRHAKGKKIILFIRRYRRPERSYYTLNISFEGDKPREIQLHGYGNERHGPHKQYTHRIPKKVRDFVDKWEKDILEPWWREQTARERKEKSA